jgi:Asp-tRNA(Asn)/Glu-tRNA(Gln) amidotransferase A subunit family amidase
MWKHKESASIEPNEISQRARDFIEFGGTFTQTDFDDAQQQRSAIHDAYMALFANTGATILITPTLGCEAFPHGTTHPIRIGDTKIEYPWLDWAGFLYDANLTGMPACSIPMGIGDEGLPLSLHIMGPPGHDMEVLNVAQKIEELINWQNPKFYEDPSNSLQADKEAFHAAAM